MVRVSQFSFFFETCKSAFVPRFTNHVPRRNSWPNAFLVLLRSTTKYYLVFELASGGELYDHLIDEGKFDEDEAREVAYALVVRVYPFFVHAGT
jgi:serine/threonine protein kinase